MKKGYLGVIMILFTISLSGCNKNQEGTLETDGTAAAVTEDTTHSMPVQAENMDLVTDIGEISVPKVMPQNELAYRKTNSVYDEEGRLSYLWTYTYDEHDNILMEEKQNVQTKESESVSNYAYIYNEQNLVEVKYWGSPDEYEVFFYDDSGNLLESCRFNQNVEAEHYCYEYDEQGNMIRQVESRNGMEYHEKKIEYEYDERGNISVTRDYDKDGNLDFSLYHEYNEENQLIKITSEFEWSKEYNYYETYEYDQNGNKIRVSSFYMNATEPYYYTIYEYDSSKRCTRKEQFKHGEPVCLEINEYEDR